jgi:hypothetical protein
MEKILQPLQFSLLHIYIPYNIFPRNVDIKDERSEIQVR